MGNILFFTAQTELTLNSAVTFTRVEKILEYIHDNIHEPLSLEGLAEKSCWSRWQLQRVFQDYTGFSVAQYVREIKLSQAAETVLASEQRMLDIAFDFGFSSEIAFSRAFKQFFGTSPKAYRKIGLKTGIRTPLTRPVESSFPVPFPEHALYQVRLDHKDAFELCGKPSKINGILASNPDFESSVPSAWRSFFSKMDFSQVSDVPHIGLIDDSSSEHDGDLTYWAGVEVEKDERYPETLDVLSVSQQNYAVLPYKGKVADFHKAIIWMIACWLPESGYKGIDSAYEIEVYYPPFDPNQQNIKAEYWLPIA